MGRTSHMRLVYGDDAPFGDRLRAQRALRQMTQQDLARDLRVRAQTVSQWEKGAKMPQSRFHDQLAEFLGLVDRTALRDLIAHSRNGTNQPGPPTPFRPATASPLADTNPDADRPLQNSDRGPERKVKAYADQSAASDAGTHSERAEAQERVVDTVAAYIRRHEGPLEPDVVRLLQSMLDRA